MEIESVKKIQTDGVLGIKKLRIQTGSIEARLTNRIQEIKERISCVEYTVEEMGIAVKENVKSKKTPKTDIQKTRDTMKRLNLRIIGIDKAGRRNLAQQTRKYFQQNYRKKNV
jgi:hypothetical protein